MKSTQSGPILCMIFLCCCTSSALPAFTSYGGALYNIINALNIIDFVMVSFCSDYLWSLLFKVKVHTYRAYVSNSLSLSMTFAFTILP